MEELDLNFSAVSRMVREVSLSSKGERRIEEEPPLTATKLLNPETQSKYQVM